MKEMGASIEIGGALRREQALAIAEEASLCGAGLDWNSPLGEMEPEDALGILLEAAGGGSLSLYDDQAVNGRFDRLEAACREAGASYVRRTEPEHGEDGAASFWTPGMAEPGSVDASADGDPMVSVSEVLSSLGDAASIEALRVRLAAMTPPAVPAFSVAA